MRQGNERIVNFFIIVGRRNKLTIETIITILILMFYLLLVNIETICGEYLKVYHYNSIQFIFKRLCKIKQTNKNKVLSEIIVYWRLK